MLFHRPRFCKGALYLSALLAVGSLFLSAPAWAGDDLSKEMILNDPAAPVSGNPAGDVTIVAFFDYNCPFCKKSEPDLERLVHEDGKIRLVYKDWPILTETSKFGARAALAAKYQGKYQQAHDALMAIPGHGISEEKMREAIAGAGVDMHRLDADLKTHASDIDTLINRNMAQADGLGLQGTPVFLIGSYLVASAIGYADFKKVVGEARAAKSE